MQASKLHVGREQETIMLQVVACSTCFDILSVQI